MRVFLWINAQPCPQPQIALPWVFTPLREGEAPAEPNVSVQFSVFSNRRILPREGEAPAEPDVSVQFSVFSNRRILPREGEAPAEPK